MQEFEAIQRIRRSLPPPPPTEVWIGDDTAVLSGMSGETLLAADLVVAGVHADLALVGLDDVGWKAVAVNVSDVAAMGGAPRYLVVSVAGPRGTDLDLLYAGISSAAATYGCSVVGGDLSSAPILVVAVTVVGDGGDGGRPPVLRSGASAGDTVFVTGPLGGSAAGLRLLRSGADEGPLVQAHRRPQARVAEGRAARDAGATAMIDVSDGFGADLGHLLDSSAVGAEIDEDALPVVEGATREEAWAGGEDYELVFTAPGPADRVISAFAGRRLRTPVAVGSITADVLHRPRANGWQHSWS
ncbi:MAG: thiamine-phosphate kinase [Actinobacteria bacterium]|nr:thiamine-phosphate kinase [Actinomycetota bacterium]